MSQIDKETVGLFTQGHLAVTTSAQQLALPTGKSLPNGIKKGVLLKCPGPTDDTPNTVTVFIGPTAGITSNLNVDTGGFPLSPGESLVIPVEQINTIWVISGAASQVLSWVII